MPFNPGKIIRGKKRSKHGISLADVPHFIQKYLIENNQFKDIENDKTLQILFKMKEREFRKIHLEKLYICPFTDQPSTLEEINNNSDKIKFNCFHCETTIISDIHDFTYENLTCSGCLKKNIEHSAEDFINYTETFRESISSHLNKERITLIKYIKKNSKL